MVGPGPSLWEPVREGTLPMADVTTELLKAHFRQLRLPTMGREFETLARDAAASNQTFAQFLLRLTEIELALMDNLVETLLQHAGHVALAFGTPLPATRRSPSSCSA